MATYFGGGAHRYLFWYSQDSGITRSGLARLDCINHLSGSKLSYTNSSEGLNIDWIGDM